ncbi:uncharacterized protein LOC141691304 [Apium graveolens]|uniref:uncharacterized protein LOC141691304 n=1 Tax=Apium graveolens TaxID=4045 RepID=UPI003D7AA2A4
MTTGATYEFATIGSTSTTNVTSAVINCNHSYYIHPSDSPGMQIIGIVLTENNYNQWHRSIEIALSSKLKLGFVDGTYVKPTSTSPLLMYWNRCNNMIMFWILNFVSEDIRNNILYIQSTREIQLDLDVRFAQSNVQKLFHLRKEIAHLSQGTLNNGKLAEFDQNLQLTQFLMGLNDSFTGIRGQILLMTLLPSLNQSYGMLLQEEKQRENFDGGGFSSETMAMTLKAYPNNKFQGTKNVIWS